MKINQIIETIEDTIKKAIEIVVTGVYYAIMLFIGAYIQVSVILGIGWIVRWLFFPELL